MRYTIEAIANDGSWSAIWYESSPAIVDLIVARLLEDERSGKYTVYLVASVA